MEPTKEAVSVTITIPRAYQHIALAATVLACFFVVFVLYRIFRKYRALHELHERESRRIQKKKRRKKMSAQALVAELHEALIDEMRGTSRQNWIMIVLTIVFITVSIFSGSIYILITQMPEKAAGIFEGIRSLFPW